MIFGRKLSKKTIIQTHIQPSLMIDNKKKTKLQKKQSVKVKLLSKCAPNENSFDQKNGVVN